MKKNFMIQYINDASKKVIEGIVAGRSEVDAATRLADRLGYLPIILSITKMKG